MSLFWKIVYIDLKVHAFLPQTPYLQAKRILNYWSEQHFTRFDQ